jgi:hypothetical protein
VASSLKRHTRFSYGKSKRKLYVGYSGDVQHAYVVLGCYLTSKTDDILFAVVPAQGFHDWLDAQKETDEDYYLVEPEHLAADFGENVDIAESLDEAVEMLVGRLRSSGQLSE